MGLLPGSRDVSRVSGPALLQHLLERGEIRWRERNVSPQSLKSDMILVLAQVGARLGTEAFVVGADARAGKLDSADLTELVLEVGVDDRLPGSCR